MVGHHTQDSPHPLGDIEDALDVERSVSAVVERVAGLANGLANKSVELAILPIINLLGVHHPQGLSKKPYIDSVLTFQVRNCIVYIECLHLPAWSLAGVR